MGNHQIGHHIIIKLCLQSLCYVFVITIIIELSVGKVFIIFLSLFVSLSSLVAKSLLHFWSLLLSLSSVGKVFIIFLVIIIIIKLC